MKLNRMRLSSRLGLAFGLLLLLSLLSSALSLYKLTQVQANLEDVVLDNNVKIDLSQQMSAATHVTARVVRTITLLHDEQAKNSEQQKIVAAREAYDKARSALEKFPASEKGRTMRAAIDAALAETRRLNNQVLELARQNKVEEATALLLKEAGPAGQRLQDALDANIQFQKDNNLKQYEQAASDYAAARALLIGFALLSGIAAVAMAVLVIRSIVVELGGEPRDVAALARAIADADLRSNISVRAGDSDSVIAAMARMQQSLTEIAGRMRGVAGNVATASVQIAQGNQDLSQRTEEQASALQQTAATMDQLSSTVGNTADSARQANQLAQGASGVAARGGEVVGQVVQTMHRINESSRKVADIIGVIDSIAFQTNILALNAAVEAARAGEQGRGFAVVAGEVRTLAQRSAEAAREIKALISGSVEQIEQGSTLVEQAGSTMQDIVGAIQRVTDIVAEISAASAEQSSGVAQVNTAVGQMDQVTQQNAALVEESAAAAESLRQQAQQLVDVAAVFKLA